MYNKATKYLEKGNVEKAIMFYKKQIKDTPFKEAYLNMGNAYRLQDRDDKAMECYLKANHDSIHFGEPGRAHGEYDFALSNMGLVNYTFERDEKAIELYRKAIELNNKHYDAYWNYASAELRQWLSGKREDGDLGWELYRYRFKRNNPVKVDWSLPEWDGVDDKGGEAICVLAEQGQGDKIMWGRYMPLLQKRFKKVYVQVPPVLYEMFSDYEPCVDPLQTEAKISTPICDLTAHLGMTNGEWLKGKYGKFDFGSGRHIGVVWSGSKTHANDRNRSVVPSYFNVLKKFGKVYNLSPDVREIKGFEYLKPKSWKETAEYVNGLDLVISIDTSIVHLAGSLGRPCWVLMPLKECDFRWGDSSCGYNNKWYSSVRVFRNPQSWDVVFRNVEAELAKYFS